MSIQVPLSILLSLCLSLPLNLCASLFSIALSSKVDFSAPVGLQRARAICANRSRGLPTSDGFCILFQQVQAALKNWYSPLPAASHDCAVFVLLAATYARLSAPDACAELLQVNASLSLPSPLICTSTYLRLPPLHHSPCCCLFPSELLQPSIGASRIWICPAPSTMWG